jgi:KUP system potassium uptake protein
MKSSSPSRQTTLMVGALGVVFGDIGTSPLYAVKECFSPMVGLQPDLPSILGILSLIFWLLLIVVSGKYLAFVLRADNKGEGGDLVLHALALKTAKSPGMKAFLIVLGMLAASFFYGDSLITPAISILGAMEGLQVAMPHVSDLIVPISVITAIALFLVQKSGTSSIGRFFGPVMFLWFSTIGVLGLRAIVDHPEVLAALNPLYAIDFISHHQAMTFLIMGAVVLAITGAEAIYADMGHFGVTPIRRAWFFFAMPGLVLNYFGQGALLLADPTAVHNPFYLLAPDWLQIPLLVLSLVAAVIASQATITGTFSVTRQAVLLGYLPRMAITHTSHHEAGQIYIPLVNYVVMVGVILLIVVFGSSGGLAAAYGISVTATMVITTLLAYQVARKLWGWSAIICIGICFPLLLLDVLLFGSNAFKIADGGWLTLAIAGTIFLLMVTWRNGSRYLYKQVTKNTIPLQDFLKSLAEKSPMRVKGTAIYLVRSVGETPNALASNFHHNRVIHERVIILHVGTSDEPVVSKANRVSITELGRGFISLDITYGFMELPSIPLILKQCVEEKKLDLDMSETSFMVSRVTLIPDSHIGLPFWQASLFRWMHVNSMRSHDFFRIPTNKALEIGVQIRV